MLRPEVSNLIRVWRGQVHQKSCVNLSKFRVLRAQSWGLEGSSSPKNLASRRPNSGPEGVKFRVWRVKFTKNLASTRPDSGS